MTRRTMALRGPALAFGAMTLFLLAACGDDGGQAAPGRVDAAGTTTTTLAVPTGDGMPVLPFEGEIEPGTVYEHQMNLHCGMDQLGELNGQVWRLTEAPSGNYEEGAGESPPDHWVTEGEGVLAHVELVSPDRIEVTLPAGELIAVYGPTDDEFQPCA